MDVINTIIGIPLGYIMWLCYELVKNYGVAILLFALLTKALMFPLNIWVQKNSIKMVKLQPRINEIAASCVGSRDTVAEKQLALYKQENYKPLAGTIPLLIQIPIILGLIAVVYNPLQHLLHIDANTINALVQKASEILGTAELGSGAQLKVIELINDPFYTTAFSGVPVSGAADAIAKIKTLDLHFWVSTWPLYPRLSGTSCCSFRSSPAGVPYCFRPFRIKSMSCSVRPDGSDAGEWRCS